MLTTARAYRGMVTAPHHLASQSGAAVLRAGGNAVEAMLAMAATIAVVYPHMNSTGGDGFWLVARPGDEPVGIRACGPAAAGATPEHYAEQGFGALPERGPLAALTVAGTVGGWSAAAELAGRLGGRLPVAELLADAVALARDGIAVSAGQARLTADKLDELATVPGFAPLFLPGGRPPAEGFRLRQPQLAQTLTRLAEAGLDDFYRGDVARSLAADLAAVGSPLRLADLEGYRAAVVTPLSVAIQGARLYNLPPPTQGLASLTILAVLDRLGRPGDGDVALVHDVVEATKQAFLVRDAHVRDPAYMDVAAESLLADDHLAGLVRRVDRAHAAPWPHPAAGGDTVWMGAVDGTGLSVSFIQSIYWEFGSGVVLPGSGVLWQNRGVSFSLADGHPNRLAPGRLPVHTLNPALARFDDGRSLVYGTMGGDGQPQTQAALFARYAWRGQSLQQAVTAPRWLLGRTWGSASTNLKVEGRFPAEVVDGLAARGHDLEVVPEFSDLMGHAGAVARHPDGGLEGAADPRSDGSVAAL